jgi:hypothetical protein
MTVVDRFEVLLWCVVLMPAALVALSLVFERLKRKDI